MRMKKIILMAGTLLLAIQLFSQSTARVPQLGKDKIADIIAAMPFM